MLNVPAGTITISGQTVHCLKLSLGLRARSCSADSGDCAAADEQTAAIEMRIPANSHPTPSPGRREYGVRTVTLRSALLRASKGAGR
jgi:hypothetical protein